MFRLITTPPPPPPLPIYDRKRRGLSDQPTATTHQPTPPVYHTMHQQTYTHTVEGLGEERRCFCWHYKVKRKSFTLNGAMKKVSSCDKAVKLFIMTMKLFVILIAVMAVTTATSAEQQQDQHRRNHQQTDDVFHTTDRHTISQSYRYRVFINIEFFRRF